MQMLFAVQELRHAMCVVYLSVKIVSVEVGLARIVVQVGDKNIVVHIVQVEL